MFKANIHTKKKVFNQKLSRSKNLGPTVLNVPKIPRLLTRLKKTIEKIDAIKKAVVIVILADPDLQVLANHWSEYNQFLSLKQL